MRVKSVTVNGKEAEVITVKVKSLNDISLNDIVADAIKTAKSKRSGNISTVTEDEAFVDESDDFGEDAEDEENDFDFEEDDLDAFSDSEELPEINELEEEYEEED